MLLNPFFGLTGDSLPSDAIAPAGSDVVGNPFQEILQGVQQAQAGGQSSGSGYPSLAELIADVISAASPQSSAEGSQNPGLERHTSGHPHQGQTVKAQIEPEVPIEPGLTNGVTSVSPRIQILSGTLESPLDLVTGLDPAVYKTTPTQTELRFSAESNHSGSGSESSSTSNHHPQPQLNTFADYGAAPTDEDASAYSGPRPGIERDDLATVPSSRGLDVGSRWTPLLLEGKNGTNTQEPHVLSDRVTEALADPADADRSIDPESDRPVFHENALRDRPSPGSLQDKPIAFAKGEPTESSEGPRVSAPPDQPVAESGQGELGFPQPDRELLERTYGSLEPNPGSLEPNLGSLEPALGSPEQGRDTNEPVRSSHEPSLGSHEPTLGSHEPTIGSHEPTIGSHEPTLGSHDSKRLIGPEQAVVSVSDRRSIVQDSGDSIATRRPVGQTSVLAEPRLRQAGSAASSVSTEDLELAHLPNRQIDPSAGDVVHTEVPVRNDRGDQPISADPSSSRLDTQGGIQARTISGIEQALNAFESSELTREELTRDVVTTMNAHQNFNGEMGHGADQRSASADLLRSMEGMAERRSVVTHPVESTEQDQTLLTGIRQGSILTGQASSGPAESLDAPRTLATLPRSAEVVPRSGMYTGDTAANVPPDVSTDSPQRSTTTDIETQTFVNRYRAEGSEGNVRREIVRDQRQDVSVRNDPHTTRDTTSGPAILDRARVVIAGSGQTEQAPVADTALRDLLPAERPEAQFIKSTPLAPESGPIPSIGAVRGSHEGTPSVDLSDQPPPQPTDVEESKVTHQIVRGARFLTREGANQVTLRLDPPELGEVTIRLSSTDKSLTGEIRVESRMVQEIVNRNIGELRESLSSQGIKVEHLEVSVESGGRSGVDRDGSTASHRENADRDRQPASDRHNPPEQRDDQREQSPRQVVREGNVDFVA